tara:strand:- start:227 stop:1579 length:1353 start_codon:yes stop_codon:yes gene_type:complete
MDIKQKLDPSIDYSARQLTNSSLTHMKLVPLSGNQSVDVSANSGTDVTFELPVQALNLGESFFQADVTIPAQGDGARAWVHKGITPWSSIQLYTRGGQYLCNIQERATDYSRVVGSSETTSTELEHGDELGGIFPITDSKAYIGGEGANGLKSKGYWEQQYLTVGGPNVAYTFHIKFPLKQLKGTIFQLNKSLLFREILVLKVKMARGTDFCFQGTDQANPDATARVINNGLNPAPAITYSNIALYVAQERNAAIVEGLSAQTSSEAGMTVFVPYPSIYTNTRSGTTQNVTLRLNKSNGSSLKSIKNCVFNNTPGDHTDTLGKFRYDRETKGQSKVVSYYANLNNNRLSEYDISLANRDDWALHRKMISNSPVYNRHIYRTNWFHQDGFQNDADKNEVGETDTNCYGGLSLDSEVRYDIYYTTANASHRHFTVVNCQKVMNINSRGIVLA